eukprot:764115-Pleurochrysis_carterae.AAC.1
MRVADPRAADAKLSARIRETACWIADVDSGGEDEGFMGPRSREARGRELELRRQGGGGEFEFLNHDHPHHD